MSYASPISPSGRSPRTPTYWRPSAAAAHEKGSPLDRFFGEKDADLPMYKDKPHSYARSNRALPYWQRRPVQVLVLLVVLGLWWIGSRPTDVRPAGGRWQGELKSSGGAKNAGVKGLRDLVRRADESKDWELRREAVREAFRVSWDAYERDAWGMDEYRPVSRSGKQTTPLGIGTTIVASLDTLIVMNLTSRLAHARSWIATSLNFTQDVSVDTAATTRQIFGGLLGAHHLTTAYPEWALQDDSDEDLFIEKATDLADRLIGAFDSPSGVPYARLNLATRRGVVAGKGATTPTADAVGTPLEWKYLALQLGEHLYWDDIEKVLATVDNLAAPAGLLPAAIDPASGNFVGTDIRVDGGAYYEALLKQYLLTAKSEAVYRQMWDQALTGIREHLLAYSDVAHLTLLGARPKGLSEPLNPRMAHAACSLAGTIALSATEGLTVAEARKNAQWGPPKERELHLARELAKTCWGLSRATRSKLAPDAASLELDHEKEASLVAGTKPLTSKPLDESDLAWKADFKIAADDAVNRLSPETISTLLVLHRVTGDAFYREWAWTMFTAWVEHSVSDGGGFAAARNVNGKPQLDDAMPSHWPAATLKYLFLLFGPADVLPLHRIVFTAAGHPLPVSELQRGLKTGWTRKERVGEEVGKRDEDKEVDSEKEDGGEEKRDDKETSEGRVDKRAEAAPANEQKKRAETEHQDDYQEVGNEHQEVDEERDGEDQKRDEPDNEVVEKDEENRDEEPAEEQHDEDDKTDENDNKTDDEEKTEDDIEEGGESKAEEGATEPEEPEEDNQPDVDSEDNWSWSVREL